MTKEIKHRVHGIDLLRGFAIIVMAAYHGLFSLVNIFGVELSWFYSDWLQNIGVPLIGGTFIFVSGLSTSFSRAVWKRGLQIFAWAMVMTFVTAAVVPSLIIRFGVLHLIGCCMLLFALLRPVLDKLPRKVLFTIAIALFAVTYHLPDGYLGWKSLISLPVQTTNSYIFPLGMMAPGFYSSDYYPLIPWFFLFIAGSCLGPYVKSGKAPKWLYPSRLPWLETIGRHTLWIYVLHQPVLIALFYGIFWLLRLF